MQAGRVSYLSQYKDLWESFFPSYCLNLTGIQTLSPSDCWINGWVVVAVVAVVAVVVVVVVVVLVVKDLYLQNAAGAEEDRPRDAKGPS